MTGDRIDKVLWAALAVVILTLLALPFTGTTPRGAMATQAQSKAREQEMLLQARRLYCQQLYEPVESLRKQGQFSQALLKLEDIGRSNPGDAYGFILRGEILAAMGAPVEAAASFAQGVRLDGSYLDKTNPLARREEINRLVTSELQAASARASANPASRSNDEALKNLRYLQSRLAGGCE